MGSGAEVSEDLSGAWSGVFNYPGELSSTEFSATLRDAGGALTGEITELAQVGAARGLTIHAWIEGRYEGARVTFAKRYDDPSHEHRVDYEGMVGGDGNEIHGRWTIVGHWSGTFIIIRSEGRTAEVESRVVERV